VREFSKNAKNYDSYNIIQKNVAKRLVLKLDKTYKKILDLGCGSGEIYRLIGRDCEEFVAVDSSEDMCKIHPISKNVKVINMDYDDDRLFDEVLWRKRFDTVCSSSSLQWSKDLKKAAKNISKVSDRCHLSIFCDGTFKTLYRYSGLESFLPKYQDAISVFSEYFNIKFEREFYKLYFDDNLSIFRYIKKSGVSGGERRLGYIETKRLIKEYPIAYLEFEVLYIIGDKKYPR